MAVPTGLSGQFGYITETTAGTAETVDKFLPFLSEAIAQDITRLESQGIRAGRQVTHSWQAGAKTIGGSLELELPNVDVAPLIKHMFGTVSTTGSGPYTHTYTPGDLTGDSFTAQIGRPDTGGTVRPFTYNGCKINSWEISSGVDEIASLSLELSAWDETTNTALASASYDSGFIPFTYVDGVLKIAGTTNNNVTEMSLSGENSLATDRHRIGSDTIIEQLANGMREYTGQITTDFVDLTSYNRFVNGTEAALVFEFDNGTDSLEVTCNVRFDGETPQVSGMEQLEQPLPFKCVSTTSDAAAITAVLINGESSSA